MYIYIYICINICVCVSIYMCVCVYIYIYIYITERKIRSRERVLLDFVGAKDKKKIGHDLPEEKNKGTSENELVFRSTRKTRGLIALRFCEM